MSSTLALLLCAVFVLFMLRLEQKQTPEMSHVLWIPTIWMLCIASKPLGVWFGTGADAEGSPLDRVFFSALLCVGLFILALRNFSWPRAIKGTPWLMLLIGYMLVSILWSDIPFISFKRWVRENLVAIVMAFLVLTERNPRQAMQSLFKRTIYILIPFSLLLIKYFPAYGVQYGSWSGLQMWVGVTMQKNGLGRLCLISAFFLIWTLVRRRMGRDISVSKYQTPADVFVLIQTLWLIKGPGFAYSATAITSLAAGLAAFVGLLWINKRRINLGTNSLTVLVALIFVFGIVTVFVGGSTVSSFTSTLGRDETLTGRTEVWADLLPIAMRKPILGSGFGGFWTPTTRLMHRISEAHSGYLDVLLELGFVGLLLVSMFLLSCCRKAQRELDNDFDWASLWICYLLMAVLHNITETSINSFTSHLTAVLLFLSVTSTAETSYEQEVSLEFYITQHNISNE